MNETTKRNRFLYQKAYKQARREHYNLLAREWQTKNRAKVLLTKFRTKTKLRTDALMAYGGKCSCCGYNNLETKLFGRCFLEIDLIAGGHNKRMKEGMSKDTYQWLRNHHYPPGFRVLCSGCNHAMPPGAEKCLLHGGP